MDLGLTDEQQALAASFGQLLAKESTPERVRSAEPLGFDESLWHTLTDTGAVAMAVPEGAGGWGASLLDLCLVAEQLGGAAAPAPVVEAQVAARVVAATAADPAVQLEPVLAGERLLTLALHRPVDGVARLVPAGAVCDDVVVIDADRLRSVTVGDGDRQWVENLAASPLADVRVGGPATELAVGAGVMEHAQSALDEWLVLTAAAIGGAAVAAVGIACEYAVERRAFGVPIGTFQGVSHPLADAVTDLDGAQLLTRKAAWSLDRREPRGRELAAMAFAFASRAAEAATYTALHTHGGYGFMLEYDVQLHYRRARGWARTWGDAEAADRRAATARYATVEGPTGAAARG